MRWMLVAGLSSVAMTARSDEPVTADSNPYVALYQARLELKKLEVQKEQKNLEYDRILLDRNARLWSQRAVSLQDYQESQRVVEIDEIEILDLVAQVKAAEAMLAIAKARSLAGEDVPICKD